MSKLKKTSKTKASDETLNAGSGKTIVQPNVNDNKLTSITELRQQHREHQLKAEQFTKELQSLSTQHSTLSAQFAQNTQELDTSQTRLQILEIEIPAQETELQQVRDALNELEQSHTHDLLYSLHSIIALISDSTGTYPWYSMILPFSKSKIFFNTLRESGEMILGYVNFED